ncbi:MAG TPA: MMPL family transporter [Thermoplasmata archaeon]|jgi:predicted RND superfamily exporter protein|nr:MMPL family transporter [Thermoplasmata archaeon]
MKIAHSLARVLVKRPKTILLVYTIITIIVGSQIRNVYMLSDLSTFLPQDDPTLQLWKKIDKEFQIGSTIIIYVEADDIRDPYVLHEMDRVTTKINTYELDKGVADGVFSVNSIAQLIKEENAKPVLPQNLGGTGKYKIPDDTNLINTYMARIQSREGILFLDSYKVAVIIFQLTENANNKQILSDVKDAIGKEARYSTMTVTGSIASQQAMRTSTFQSLIIVFPLAALGVACVLFLFHRTLKGLLIGFMPLGYALLLTFGVLGTIQPELTILSIAVAALLLGLGVDYSIYLANRFAEECTLEDKIERVECTLGRTGKAVFMCALTTIVGFGSLMTSSLPPMVTFGFSCAIGITFAFLSATILVPCLCLILRFEKHETIHQWKRFAKFLVEYRKKLFAVACFFVVLSILVLPRVTTDVNYLDMAPQGIPEVETLLEYSKNFGSGTNFNALYIETDSQGLTYPEVIEAIYNMEEQIRAAGGSAYSIADEIKKINDVLDRSVIIEKIAEFMGVNVVILDKIARTGLVDEQYSKTIILVTFPAGQSVKTIEKLVNNVNEIAQNAEIPQNGYVSRLTGQDVVSVEIDKQIMSSQATSLIIALLLVLACLIIGFNSIGIGMLALIPVLVVIAWEPGALVMMDIPLSIINITVASIMIGTGIDYSIQTTQRVREEIAKGVEKTEAVITTIETTGWSLVGAATTTIVALLSTFAVNIPSLHQFSIVVITLIGFSFVASLCILPTLLTSRLIK